MIMGFKKRVNLQDFVGHRDTRNSDRQVQPRGNHFKICVRDFGISVQISLRHIKDLEILKISKS